MGSIKATNQTVELSDVVLAATEAYKQGFPVVWMYSMPKGTHWKCEVKVRNIRATNAVSGDSQWTVSPPRLPRGEPDVALRRLIAVLLRVKVRRRGERKVDGLRGRPKVLRAFLLQLDRNSSMIEFILHLLAAPTRGRARVCTDVFVNASTCHCTEQPPTKSRARVVDNSSALREKVVVDRRSRGRAEIRYRLCARDRTESLAHCAVRDVVAIPDAPVDGLAQQGIVVEHLEWGKHRAALHRPLMRMVRPRQREPVHRLFSPAVAVCARHSE